MTQPSSQIIVVESFNALVSATMQGNKNAVVWERHLRGDFEEIVTKLLSDETITQVDPDMLLRLELSELGHIARQTILYDYRLLKDYQAAPQINIIKHYERDEDFLFFPTDVYSFHVDRSPIASDTFLCSYFGATTQILENQQAIQKIQVPEIRQQILQHCSAANYQLEDFVEENFLDLHYQALPNAVPVTIGQGHLVRLAVDHPAAATKPCIHRAPEENPQQARLLLIC